MKARSALIAACTAALLGLAARASAATTDFIGQWTNVDPGARGLSQVAIRADSGQLLVHVWGKCHPQDCDWGEQAAELFVPNPGVPVDAGVDKLIVQFNQRATQTMVVLEKSEPGLSIKTFTAFTDSSNRSNYHASARFIRQ